MDEKLPPVVDQQTPESVRRRPRTFFPYLRQTLLLALVLVVVYSVHKIPVLRQECPDKPQPVPTKKVPLEIHNMAKCGNARV